MIDYKSVLELRKAKQELLAKLYALKVPALSHCSDADELLGAKEHLQELCKVVDTYIEKVGEAAKRSTTANIDDRHFRQATFSALDSFAFYELEAAAEEARIEEREAA